MALHINQDTYNGAIEKMEAGDVAGAWQVLSEGGDLYAARENNRGQTPIITLTEEN